ncbi:MAG: adenosylhomocysteinase [Candidatus Saganbacteria bacterium]|nr:adenosylhomocysteinase [Candidatus Saganbacteria bacterium]
MVTCDIKDKSLAGEGKLKTEWAARNMPVLLSIKERFGREKPLKGIRVSACLHVTSETANLMAALKAGGADVVLTASNPLSTQDDVAAHIAVDLGIPTYAIKGEDNDTYYKHLNSALGHNPSITMDDGADLISELHKGRAGQAELVIGGTEETTTGVIRLRNMERSGALKFPVIAVNDAMTKHLFDNRYGTGQSTIDGILRATNMLIAGSIFVVCGYGYCGKGVAMRARGMGAKVIVTETDPLRALEATMDGFDVMSVLMASKLGDIFVTVTGDINVLGREQFKVMKDGAILANSGHFNVEIDIEGLEDMKKGKRRVRGSVDEYELKDGRKLYLLGEGRLINLAAAEGHPAMVMDMSFSDQALSVEYLVKEGKKLEKKVYAVPPKIDREIAVLKLRSMNISIDELSAEQRKYLESWRTGT